MSGPEARPTAGLGGEAEGAGVVAFAPAKLNLTLAVTGRRPDGFHALHSVMVPLDFGDEIVLEAAAGPSDSLEVEGSGELPAGVDNLLLRAVEATRTALLAAGVEPGRLLALTARLRKRIPIAAGMGGGSSDAAAAIAGAQRVWQAALPSGMAGAAAAALGSDVPFFLAGGPALITGRGEFVEPLPPFTGAAPAVLVVTPRWPLATAAVFGAYAAGARPTAAAAARTLAAGHRLAADMRSGLDAAGLLDRAGDLAAANDLLPASLSVVPELASFRVALEDLLGRPVGQSGSGPTAWALYASRSDAERAGEAVARAAERGRLPRAARGGPIVIAAAIGAPSAHNEAAQQPQR